MVLAAFSPPPRVPAEAHTESPPAWIEGGCAAAVARPSVDPAVADATARHKARRQLTRAAAQRARVWLRRNASRKQHAASRACRPKRSPNCRWRGSRACALACSTCRISPFVDPAIAEGTVGTARTGSLPEPPRNAPASGCARTPYASSAPPRVGGEVLRGGSVIGHRAVRGFRDLSWSLLGYTDYACEMALLSSETRPHREPNSASS